MTDDQERKNKKEKDENEEIVKDIVEELLTPEEAVPKGDYPTGGGTPSSDPKPSKPSRGGG